MDLAKYSRRPRGSSRVTSRPRLIPHLSWGPFLAGQGLKGNTRVRECWNRRWLAATAGGAAPAYPLKAAGAVSPPRTALKFA